MATTTPAERERNPIDAPDTNNATFIDWQELPLDETWTADYHPLNKRDYFQYLDRMNGGYQNGPTYQNKRYETFRLNRWLILSLGDNLLMSDRLRSRALTIFTGLDRSELGVEIQGPALTTCAFVIHQNDPYRECHPQTNSDVFDPTVEAERVRLDVSRKQYMKLYGKIEHRVRTGKLSPVEHDKYDIDPDGLSPWREIEPDWDEEWL